MTDQLQAVLQKTWGFEGFLPMQREAMEAVLQGRDSLVVLPTGGGKSLCFQAPALLLPHMSIVVSPLLSLMKDQVDGLAQSGVPAARLDSSMPSREKGLAYGRIRDNSLKILYVSPERLLNSAFLDFLRSRQLSSIAIDEAHCVSMWGHDFRPEYRQLHVLREAFPAIPVGAYTATATAHVRCDIEQQLHLERPALLVGHFDRPNLLFRVRRRSNLIRQVTDVLQRHKGDSGIVYCIRRADVDDLCADLAVRGFRAAPYHAGMDDAERRRNQDAFIEEQVDTIVATVAFGMGIDKSNVRYVVHTGMPKSIEHYQQESGRAGRDGLEAECLLLYSGADYLTWKRMVEEQEPSAREVATMKLGHMYHYCSGVGCRHQALVRYFGQELPATPCRACDFCLGELQGIPEALVVAQKILSSVIRQGENFGAEYTAGVLTGSREDRVIANLHDRLSTYGLLSQHARTVVRDWIEQLVDQGCVARVGEYGVLRVTDKGRRVLKGQEAPLLIEHARKKTVLKHASAADSWDGVDRGLFEVLRSVRRRLAQDRLLPAYIVFSDAALRDMARKRPMTPGAFLGVSGVGHTKLNQYGPAMLEAIRDYCRASAARDGTGSG